MCFTLRKWGVVTVGLSQTILGSKIIIFEEELKQLLLAQITRIHYICCIPNQICEPCGLEHSTSKLATSYSSSHKESRTEAIASTDCDEDQVLPFLARFGDCTVQDRKGPAFFVAASITCVFHSARDKEVDHFSG